MRTEFFIATRYLQASGRGGFVSFITGFAVLGVTIGTAAVIIALSILNGFEKEIKEKIFGFASHVQVIGFQNQPLQNYRDSMLKVRKGIPAVHAITPFVAKEAMIRVHDEVDGIFLKGVDPSSDLGVIKRYLIRGRSFSNNEPSTAEIVIGKKLADKLGVTAGDKVVVFGLPRQSREFGLAQPRAMIFQIVGIFESGMIEYDDTYAFTTLQNAQRLFQLGDAILGFDVFTSDLSKASEVASDIQKLLEYPHYARTAAQLYRNLFAWIELQKKPAPIFLGIIIIVATVNIIGTLLMLVLEKTRDIGILKSIGASPPDIRNIFVIQGLCIALLGVAFGNALAYILCWMQLHYKPLSLPSDIYFMSTVPILLLPENFLLVSLAVLLLCLSAAFLPSRAAAKLDPVASLRFG